MTKWCSKLVVSLIFLAGIPQCPGKELAVDAALGMDSLQETVNRYFSSMGGYQEGDLITQSQVEELQAYLRKTRGHSAASHPRILKRILPDDSRLAQLFYKKNGAEVLRVVAAIKGGYEIFDQLSRTSANYSLLVEAVDRGTIEKLHQMADQESKRHLALKQEKGDVSSRRTIPTRIYTTEDYLAAVKEIVEKKAAVALQDDSKL